jgi:hypothetical protein
MRISLLFFALLLGASVCQPAGAQTGSMFNQRDDTYRLLGLKRAKDLYDVARRELDRQKELFRRGLISQSDLDRAEASFADADVNYQQSLLAVLFEQQYVTIARAVKSQSPDGTKRVRLLVANASGGSAELRKLVNIDDKLFRSLQPDIINNVYVSLQNNDGAIISQPYESKIDVLRYGSPQELDFTLLQDVDAVTVSIIYGNGTQRTMKIYLQKDASANKVLVQSDQFSQEGELGKTAKYDLTLELFSRTSNTFGLEVANLPQQIGRVFRDPSSNAMIGQFRFLESVDTRKVSLEVSLPDRPTSDVVMDKAISFYVLVIPHDRLAGLGDIEAKTWTPAAIEKLDVGFLRLELVPRGKGRLLVRASQLYQAIHADGTVSMNVDVVNDGSRRLDNVEMKADAPLNWTKSIDPALIPQLAVSGEQRVNLTFTPPGGIPPGRYEIRLQTSALSDNEPVNAEDKTLTVEVQAETNILGTILILVLVFSLVGGVVFLGIRLSRR